MAPGKEGDALMTLRASSSQPRLNPAVAREIGQALIVLALTGSSVGGFLGIIAIATRALGR
jgi:hypothetical protein